MSGGIKHWIDKVSGECADERHCACETIAGMSDQLVSVPESLLNEVMRALTSRLSDECLIVRSSAVGALRNLCSDVGDAARKFLVAEPTTVNSIVDHLKICPIVDEDEAEEKKRVQLESVFLLTDLCGNSEEAVMIFNRTEGGNFVLSLLMSSGNTTQLQIASAELLQILSENNSHLAKVVAENRNFLGLMMQTPHSNFEQLYIKTLCCSITYNILQSNNDDQSSETVAAVAQMLLAVLETNFSSVFAKVVAAFEASQGSDVKTKIEDLKFLLKSQQVALETVANIFNTDDSDDEWEDVESGDENPDAINGDETHKDAAMDCDKSPSSVSALLTSELSSRDVIAKVFACFDLKDLESLEFIKSRLCNESLLESMKRKFRAMLGCVGNLVYQSELDRLGGADGLVNLFEWLIGLAKTFEGDCLLLIDCTGAMNSTVRKIAAVNHPRFMEMCGVHLRSLFDLGSNCSDNTLQVNLLRTISSFGCSVSKVPSSEPQLLMVAEYLFRVASEAEALWISAEALDAIFDVFAEDETNGVLRQFQMVDKMKRLLPDFSKKCREQKRSCSGEQRLVVSTVQSNFARFIEYKSSLV